ncbi:MAG: thioredoxin family protein [Candidatus Gracilibacteria bacterium]|nr:thioredoxin family protein [Candidatus Gracilibacteria bacterium]
MALLESLSLPLGSDLIPFSLPDPDGNQHDSSDYKDRKALVVIFMCNHCPYIKAIQERLIALQANYENSKVQLIGINSNDAAEYPEDSPEMMKTTIKEWGINFPYLIDEDQAVGKAYQAQCTPDIYVFDENQKLAYHGRVDDNWKEPENVTKEELKEAIDALLNSETPSSEQHPSIGCSIKWK